MDLNDMRYYERSKRALYWTAISLIVCDGLPLEQAARHMGIDDERLRDILHRRRTVHLRPSSAPNEGMREDDQGSMH